MSLSFLTLLLPLRGVIAAMVLGGSAAPDPGLPDDALPAPVRAVETFASGEQLVLLLEQGQGSWKLHQCIAQRLPGMSQGNVERMVLQMQPQVFRVFRRSYYVPEAFLRTPCEDPDMQSYLSDVGVPHFPTWFR